MAARTLHPGVYIQQRSNGGTWYARFFTWHTGTRQQISKSLLTDDHDIAKRIAREVSTFMHQEEQWTSPPTDLHPRTYELLGIDPHDKDSQTVARSLRVLSAGAKMAGLDASPTLQRVRLTVANLQKRLDAMIQERDGWKRRAVAAEGQLSKMGRLANKARASVEGTTLQQAWDVWSTKLTGDAEYVKNQAGDALMYVRKFGPDTLLTEMSGLENEIDGWIRKITKVLKVGGKIIEKPIGAGRRLEIRRVVLKFMRESGIELEKKAIKRPSKKDVRNDRGAIRWLTRPQAKAVMTKLTDRYFHDCFVIQLALGLRPDELLTLKKADFLKTDDGMTLTLSPLDHLTLKEGSRSITVPQHIHHIIEKRLNAYDILFPHITRSGKTDGKAWDNAKSFDRRYLAALRKAGKAAGIPFAMDCRIPRRTCATLLLGAGVAPKAVADILGDNLQTVIEHYAAAIPGAADPSKAAIT